MAVVVPRITVAIPTYNRAKVLHQTLEGVMRQRPVPGGFEVLVIDNNSRDTTRAVVEAFAGLPNAPRYLLETNQGLDHARNRSIPSSKETSTSYPKSRLAAEMSYQCAVESCWARKRVIGGSVEIPKIR